MSRILGENWMVPPINDGNRAFFTSGMLSVVECQDCGSLQHPPEDVCSHCQGHEFGIRTSEGKGRIESVAMVHHPIHPGLAEVSPYAVLVVSVEDLPGVHLIGNLHGAPASEAKIGRSVQVVFEDAAGPEGEALKIPQWELHED